ncbi:hypothetical protein NMY22_g14508 [Coprinellus aureogranulatus]|nr:hypothetical protein NMY22_g14508 [Coprinellus aureogranulatus]
MESDALASRTLHSLGGGDGRENEKKRRRTSKLCDILHTLTSPQSSEIKCNLAFERNTYRSDLNKPTSKSGSPFIVLVAMLDFSVAHG